MIKIVNHKTLSEHGHLLTKQFELRYKEFIERQAYNVSTFDYMEYDKYDTPAATYLIYEGEDDSVQGVSRITPVKNSCMLKELWPELLENPRELDDPSVWESSRFCINKDLPSNYRRRICYELALANVEYSLMEGITKIVGMMPTLILRSVFERSGIFLERLGPVCNIPGFRKVQAAAIPINWGQIESVYKKTGIKNVIANSFDTPPLKQAA